MLVAVEGPSAVGKSTLLRLAAPASSVVDEDWEAVGLSRAAGPAEPLSVEAQGFWVDLNIRRWALLLEVEQRCGIAYADTDPPKLYYNFALARIGELPRGVLEQQWYLTREAIGQRRLGFVDRVVYLDAAPRTLARRRAGDTSRTRRNFRLHQRLVGAMGDFYATLERIRPGTVRWMDAEREVSKTTAGEALTLDASRRDRYDLTSLDALKAELDRILQS